MNNNNNNQKSIYWCDNKVDAVDIFEDNVPIKKINKKDIELREKLRDLRKSRNYSKRLMNKANKLIYMGNRYLDNDIIIPPGSFESISYKMAELTHNREYANGIIYQNRVLKYREKIKYHKFNLEIYNICKYFKEKEYVEISKYNEKRERTRDNMTKTSLDLTYIDKLPEDIVNTIKSFLSYDTRIYLLEDKYKFNKWVNRLLSDDSILYLHYLYTTPDYLSLLTEKEYNSTYEYYHITGPVRKQRIFMIYYKFKEYNPAAAFKMIKNYSILFGQKMIKNKKKYCGVKV